MNATSVLYVSALLCLYGAYRLFLRWSLQGMYRTLKANGYPTTLEELNAWYVHPPEGQNAANDILQAARLLDAVSEAEGPLLENDVERYFKEQGRRVTECPSERGISVEDESTLLDRVLAQSSKALDNAAREELGRFLEPRTEALTLVYRAVQKINCRYPVDFTLWPESVNELTTNATALRRLVRLLRIEALAKVATGDVDAAARSVASSMSLVATLNQEPTAMSQLVRSALLLEAVRSLDEVLNGASLEERHLAHIEQAINRIGSDSFARGFAGERCLVRGDFRIEGIRRTPLERLFGTDTDSKIALPQSPKSGVMAALKQWRKANPWLTWRLLYEIPYKIAGLQELEELFCVTTLNRLVSALQAPLRERAKKQQRVALRLRWIRPFLPQNAKMMLWNLAIPFGLQDPARIGLVRLALAVERYRLQNGTLPKAASELVGAYIAEVPLDLFDGNPLRYERLQQGYLVYSVGPEVGNTVQETGRRDRPGYSIVVLR